MGTHLLVMGRIRFSIPRFRILVSPAHARHRDQKKTQDSTPIITQPHKGQCVVVYSHFFCAAGEDFLLVNRLQHVSANENEHIQTHYKQRERRNKIMQKIFIIALVTIVACIAAQAGSNYIEFFDVLLSGLPQ